MRVRDAVRGILVVSARAVTAPAAAFWLATGRRVGVFRSIMQAAAWLPGALGSVIRVALLQWMAKSCASRVRIEMGTIFSNPEVEILEHAYIGAFCSIGWARIGEYALLGTGVHVVSGPRVHRFERTDVPIALQGGEPRMVTIGRGSWVGNGAIVMADVGEECVIGAGAVVTKPVPPWSIAVGVPARPVAKRGTV
ncbi:MAG: acyltransferase [Armatimonadota bacterium]